MWFDKSQFLQESFDVVKHVPAAFADPEGSDFLRQILRKRDALDLMDEAELGTICLFSGGVLRDLITLARSSAEYAYDDDIDRIGSTHVQLAVRQLGRAILGD